MDLIFLIKIILLYLVPLYVANAFPVVFHGKTPIDFGKKIGTNRILGDGKTWKGAIAGILAGTFAGIIISFIYPEAFNIIPHYIWLSFFLSVGVILGDIIKSFFKRRLNFKRGEMWFPFDQLDFIFGGFLFSLLIRMPELEMFVILLGFTIIFHLGANYLAFKLKLKKVPW